MKMKKIFTAATLSLALCGAGLAEAADLYITNSTKHDSTTKSYGRCSNFLSDGVTPSGAVNHKVPEWELKLACVGHTSDCSADVYMSDNCTDSTKIGTVRFDVTGKGLIGSELTNKSYQVSGSGFNLSISGGDKKLAAK